MKKTAKPVPSNRSLFLVVALAALCAFNSVRCLSHSDASVHWQAAMWGLAVLASFTGFGTLTARLLFPGTTTDLGLRAALGMAFVLALGGLLVLVGLASSPVLLTLVVTGQITLIACAWIDRAQIGTRLSRCIREDRWFYLPLAGIVVLLAARYWRAILRLDYNPNDDWVAYIHLTRKLLDTGSLVDPFSLRRLMSYGGQELFKALHMAIGTGPYSQHLFDQGLCPLVIAALIWGHARDGSVRDKVVALVALFLFVVLPEAAVNTSSTHSSIIFFLALFRMLSWQAATPTWRTGVAVGMLGIAVCTLRQTFLGVAFIFVALSYAFVLLQARLQRDYPSVRAHAAELLWAGIASIACFAPWALAQYRSGNTLMFPIMQGNFVPEAAAMFADLTLAQSWDKAVSVVRAHTLLQGTLWFLPALLLAPDRTARRPLIALLVGTSVGMFLIFRNAIEDYINLRYFFSFVATLLIATLLLAGRSWLRSAVTIALAGVVIHITHGWDQPGKLVNVLSVKAPDQPGWYPLRLLPAYQQMQAALLPDTTVLVAVDDPWVLDQRRNHVLSIDVPGSASPPPKLPFGRGSDAWADYFRGIGIRYLVWTRPERARSMYRRDIWEKHARGTEQIWRLEAPYYLETFRMFEELGLKYRHAFESDLLVAIDLTANAT